VPTPTPHPTPTPTRQLDPTTTAACQGAANARARGMFAQEQRLGEICRRGGGTY
jgi:hypothetical protein